MKIAKMRSRRVVVAAAAATVALFIAACGSGGGSSSGDSGQESYVIGATFPLSGEAASVGEFAVRGAELAAEYLRTNGGPDLRFSWEDSQLDTQVALQATQKLVNSGVAAVLSGGSSVLMAQAPVATRDQFLLVNIMAQSPVLAGASEWLFNILPTSDGELTELAEIAVKERGLRTIGMLVVDNDLGSGDAKVLTQEVEARGGSVPIVERFPVGATDMRTALLRIRDVNPDGLYIIGNTDELGYAISQAKELGLRSQLLGRTQSIDPSVLRRAGDAANGMIGVGTIFRPASDNEVGQRFLRDYQAAHNGEYPSVYAATTYDGVLLLGEALKTVGDDPARIRDFLRNVTDFPGAMGAITIGEDNTASYPLVRYEVVNGQVQTAS